MDSLHISKYKTKNKNLNKVIIIITAIYCYLPFSTVSTLECNIFNIIKHHKDDNAKRLMSNPNHKKKTNFNLSTFRQIVKGKQHRRRRRRQSRH